MKYQELLQQAHDSLTGSRVYAEAYQQDGITVITAASVMGGGGGGTGTDKEGQEGEGGGLGLAARPTGAFVIKNGKVAWVPAVDVNRVVAISAVVAVVAILCATRVARARARAD
ncbi:MAG: hypothetical protein R2737_00040 [Candidatus Nanopelagicales bacterium]